MSLDIQSIVQGFKQKRILVIGDLLLDRYIWGDVTRISPEAPVPVIHVFKETFTAGGAGNVAFNLSSLGIKTEVIGSLGHDDSGRDLISLLNHAGVDTGRCCYDHGRSTIVKTRVVARNQQLCRIDKEGGRESYRLYGEACLNEAAIMAAVREADSVIVSDYAKGVVNQELFDRVVLECKQHNTLLAVDPKPSRNLDLTGATLLTPNRNEALELAGIVDWTPAEIYPLEQIVSIIHQKFAPDVLVVTLGADGMAVAKDGKVIQTLPTQAREVYDVSGAGDTVIATLTAALTAGADPVASAILANHAAGIVVSKMGTAVVTDEELIKANTVNSGS